MIVNELARGKSVTSRRFQCEDMVFPRNTLNTACAVCTMSGSKRLPEQARAGDIMVTVVRFISHCDVGAIATAIALSIARS